MCRSGGNTVPETVSNVSAWGKYVMNIFVAIVCSQENKTSPRASCISLLLTRSDINVTCWCMHLCYYRIIQIMRVCKVQILLEEVVYVHCSCSFLLKAIRLQQLNSFLLHVQVLWHRLKVTPITHQWSIKGWCVYLRYTLDNTDAH